MNNINKEILAKLPYKKPFLFVDKITEVTDQYIVGEYTFSENEFFYQGHFKNNPVTPGVILLETMGQIGLVCFSIFLTRNNEDEFIPLLSYLQSEFDGTVLPKEKVVVKSEKIYLRNNILKCDIKMFNEKNKIVAKSIAILKLN